MKIGFTGTRKGMTEKQRKLFTKLIIEKNPSEFHHGDCVGSDSDAHTLIQIIKRAHYINTKTIIHPSTLYNKRAYCSGDNIEIRQEKPPLERNKDIVNETDLLIACPKSDKEELRSGTWATIRYARKVGKKIIIILPNGEVR